MIRVGDKFQHRTEVKLYIIQKIHGSGTRLTVLHPDGEIDNYDKVVFEGLIKLETWTYIPVRSFQFDEELFSV